MHVYVINDEQIIKKAQSGEVRFQLKSQFVDDAIIIVNADHPVYYESEYFCDESQMYIIRKCDTIGDLSTAEIKILKGLMSSYSEMADISATLCEFPGLTEEKLRKSISGILGSVKRQGKINNDEQMFLYDILSGQKTKKQLIKDKVCTFEQLHSAFGRFCDEAVWCYGFYKAYVDHRIKNFDSGDIEFLWTVSDFFKEYRLDSSVLFYLFNKLLYNEKFLSLVEKKEFFGLIEKFLKGYDMSGIERSLLNTYVKLIYVRFEEILSSRYDIIAQLLIDKKRTNIKQIKRHCAILGYCTSRVVSSMKKLGVELSPSSTTHTDKFLDVFLDDDFDEDDIKKKDLQGSKIFIVSGPSCSGKTTIFNEIMKAFPDFVKTISDTTRSPRENERDGVDYNFVSKELFERKRDAGEYIEHIYYDNNYYGTSKESIEQLNGKYIAMIIDVDGAKKIKQQYNNVITIFIMPPSVDELRRRLIGRGDNTEEEIERRLAKAEKEMSECSAFDFVVKNEDFNTAVQEVTNIIFQNIG